MVGEEELVDGSDGLDCVAAIDEDAQVARERCRIAGDDREAADLGGCERFRLRLGTRERRVEDRGIEAVELSCREGSAEEIPHGGSDGFQALRAAGRGREGRQRVAVAVVGGYAGVSRKRQSECANAREKVGDVPPAGEAGHDEPDQRGLCFRRRLEECSGSRLDARAAELDLGPP